MNKVGAAGAGEDATAAGCERVLESAARGGADAHHAPPGPEGAVQGGRGRRRYLVVLGVETVLARVIRLHRLERPRPDMEREADRLDAAVGQRLEHLGGEVEARRGRRHGAAGAGVDGLVALAGGGARAVLAPDVWRQRHLADGGERCLVERRRELHPPGPLEEALAGNRVPGCERLLEGTW